MSDWPLVSVCIVAYNRRDELTVTLRDVIERLDYPSDRLEIIVVDNASTDGTAEAVRADFPDVELLVNAENVGVSAWNRAFARARGDFYLALDDDCSITGGTLKEAVTKAREHGADLTSFYVRSPEGYRDFSEEVRTGLLSFWGCSAMLSRRAVEATGGYDPRIFIWGNEVDLTMRILDRGMTHLYLSTVRSLHRKAPGPFALRGYRLNIRHHAYIAAKLLRGGDAAGALINILVRALGEAIYHRDRLPGVLDLFAGARDGLRHRAPVRTETSRLYRRNFIFYSSPLHFARGPRERLRGRGVPDAAGMVAQDRTAAFHRARPHLYPDETALLRV